MDELVADTKDCIYCKRPMIAQPSTLDQSGNTHLPAKKYNCGKCEYTIWLAVILKEGKSWLPNE